MRSHSAVLPTVYVDSVSGNDSYDGLSAATPKLTLAAAVAIAGANARIGLAKGSFWRESLDVSSLTAPTVMTYGTGNPPRITGANTIDAGDWSKTVGRTNVYETTITHDASGSNRLRVYQVTADVPPVQTQLVGVNDVATCDSTPGSFVRIVGSDGSPVTLYIHAVGSVDPRGSETGHEYTTRTNGIYGPNDCTILGPIRTGEAISNNGSTDLVGRTGGSVSKVIGSFGSKHNLGIGAGSMEDCIAIFADEATAAEPSNTQFVAFVNDGSGLTAEFVRCGVVGYCPGTDWVAHGNPTSFDSVALRQFWVNETYGFASDGNLLEGNYYNGVQNAPGTNGTIRQMLYRHLWNGGGVAGLAYYGDVTIRDSAYLVRQRPSGNFNPVFRLLNPAANQCLMEYCAMFMDVSAGINTNWFANSNSNARIEMNFCVSFYGVNHMEVSAGAVYVGDFNVFCGYNNYNLADKVNFQSTAGYRSTLALWQSDTGQDANSVWLDKADQVRGDSNAFWLGVANDENDGPMDGDWRINPNARVYDSSDVAHIGTFADGTTPITAAGPQSHWDWNARAVVSGPPTAWPTVPEDLSEGEEYIADPEGWDFYP